jgi:hypothetical protein
VSAEVATAADMAAPAREFVLLAREAAVRGFKTVLAMRRFCRKHNISVHRMGRKEWVRPADIDAAVARSVAATHGEVRADDNVARAVALLKQKKVR